ncbi:AAA family ATPase [Algoriphagus yeomjeoni]|uniref:Wobble nucleotide-excising tRNase n=1 Tax=Algoriphagus yeomjeoni TaxID=291403 RepID=A0A327P110_9BACT|nr:AAA family ATPase [Algoriphagus yeomjeoni]RAI84724.1 wobble nucleotide-excising tRNase [Algoriphagus yeomjeoni]
MKSNAKEYLKEFASSQPDWLKALIYDSIESNGNITNERKNEIFRHITNGVNLNITEPNLSNETNDSEIRLTKLIHKSGVNALKEDQTIKFSNDVTILYGMNGAGKSSYFKVLNEIVGGNQKKEILPNIYAETSKPIQIELSFEPQNGQNQSIIWNGSNRSLDLLNKCKVFDTSYLESLLTTRKADSTLIQPLGLNLFAYLVGVIDDFKDKINNKADKKRLEKPTLELKHFRDDIKTSFEIHQVSSSIKSQVEKLYSFSNEDAEKLKTKQSELKNLKQINIQDKIRLKENDKNELESVKSHIDNAVKKISGALTSTQNLIKTYSESKEANKLAKRQFEILSNIPANNTEEWKEFIKAGEKYTSKLDPKEKVCAYCRQPLADDNSINLVQSYGNFLKDESEQKLNGAIQNLESLKQRLNGISVKLEIKENIETILKETKITDSDETLNQLINNIISNLEKGKEKLITAIDSKRSNDVKIELQNKDVIKSNLSAIIENLQAEIIKFENDNKDKNTQIEKLEKEIKGLLENESISQQKENLEKWFSTDSVEKELRQKSNKINTTKVSNLSKTAHNDLLTETLKTNFTDELTGLGFNKLEVKIENAKGQKGTSNTKLTLTKNKDIKAVLSEGEQKAVALALFIAEAKIQKSINPIILDDPVNSLDHKIAGNFANRLLQLENQIILFNHNKLFLEAFETSKGDNHICNTIETCGAQNKGKHIKIYMVNNEGVNSKGVLGNYKRNKAKYHITDAKRLLNHSPFEDSLKVASLLRKAVECVIDEKILNNQIPTKYSTGNNHINWDELKNLNNNELTINSLKSIHGRVSGGEMHNGTENEENPIEVDEFNTMISDIEQILN